MTFTIDALPYPTQFEPHKTALLLIDMQRDFLLPDGFGETLGNDVSLAAKTIQPCTDALARARAMDMLVIHTREGHRPDLSDVFPSKLKRCRPSLKIGDRGKMGRILIRGEFGHDLIDELQPAENEVVIDKPGKGAFYATELDLVLRRNNIDTLFVGGVTTEVCVTSTIREANDRGYNCIAIDECCGSYFPEFHKIALEMIAAQGGIFGFVTSLNHFLKATKDSE